MPKSEDGLPEGPDGMHESNVLYVELPEGHPVIGQTEEVMATEATAPETKEEEPSKPGGEILCAWLEIDSCPEAHFSNIMRMR